MDKLERIPFSREENTFIIRFKNGVSCFIQLLPLQAEQCKSYSFIEQLKFVLFCSAAYVKVGIINELTLEDLTHEFVDTKDGLIYSPEQLLMVLQKVFGYVDASVID